MNLYEIKQEFEKAIEECVDMETGEIINPTRLDELNMVLTDKRENVALYIKNLSAEEKAIDEEAKNLTNRKRVLNNKVEGLKKSIKQGAVINGVQIITKQNIQIK